MIYHRGDMLRAPTLRYAGNIKRSWPGGLFVCIFLIGLGG